MMADKKAVVTIVLVGVGIAATTIALSLRRTSVKLKLEKREDGKIRYLFTVKNASSEPLHITGYQMIMNGVESGWNMFAWTVAPNSSDVVVWEWVEPSYYLFPEGENTSAVRLRDSEGNIYESSTIRFRV